jgi:hypothetical protein
MGPKISFNATEMTELLTTLEHYRKLTTCKNCNQWKSHHAGKDEKCLFGPGTYEPIE